MAKEMKTPGVYIEEIGRFPPAIAQVETAVPAFIGYTQMAKKSVDNDLDFVPHRISSMLEYERYFGQMESENVVLTITDTLQKTNAISKLVERKITATIPTPSPHIFWYQMQFYFANGGGPCYIISTGRQTGVIQESDLLQGLQAAKKESGITLLVFPEGGAMANVEALYALYNAALEQAQQLQNRFVICDVSNQPVQHETAVSFFRKQIAGGSNGNALRYGAAYYPYLKTNIHFHYVENAVIIHHRCITQEQGLPNVETNGVMHGLPMAHETVKANIDLHQIQTAIEALPLSLAASCAVAGAYATMDNTRGVWKAPANIGLNGVVAPEIAITNDEQQALNISIDGKSINTIRSFVGRGVIIWGARTLDGNSNDWRYVSVRRTCIMIETSVSLDLQSFVFEPNDANTWVRVQGMIENFLTQLWRQGALAGAKPEEAFSVAIGLGKTMTPRDILEGYMTVQIMLAIVRPAEFIVIRLRQKMIEA